MIAKLQSLKWWLPTATLGAAIASGLLLTAEKTPGRYVAHEWGTFTSVQGADGALLNWRPLQSSRLPNFVYDWTKPGLGRQPGAQVFPSKSALVTLQRMETPVIYLYADKPQTVDVSVHFPHGQITEWYPQADQIGPFTAPAPRVVAALDTCGQRLGAKLGFTLASLLPNAGTPDSQVQWRSVEVTPKPQEHRLQALLPKDHSGSHYFTARNTDANVLRVTSHDLTNTSPQYEKFIFYRGVGNFSTPLRTIVDSGNTVTLVNEGEEALPHLFVLEVENQMASYVYVSDLRPGERRRIQLSQNKGPEPLKSISSQLSAKLSASLEHEGLYAREAKAMVSTWKDSWFEESGLRVLYVLPRGWTDRTLPLTLDPAPRELTRVMVGRAEILPSALEHKLAAELTQAEQGDADARREFETDLQTLGRFAEPAFRQAIQGATSDESQKAWALFQSATKLTNPAID